jgi:hypothetical protein
MSLMDEFIENKGRPITHQGRELFWTYLFPVTQGDVVRLRFCDFKREPQQGIVIDCDHCVAKVEHSQAKKFQLWTNTAPEVVIIHVIKAEPDAQFAIFNVWRGNESGPMLYRLNDASMIVQRESEETTVLHCSDGVGAATFDDLKVELTHSRRVTKR